MNIINNFFDWCLSFGSKYGEYLPLILPCPGDVPRIFLGIYIGLLIANLKPLIINVYALPQKQNENID